MENSIDWLSTDEATPVWKRYQKSKAFREILASVKRCEPLPADVPISPDALRIVAISDTHGKSLCHLNLPEGDILIHAGDMTMDGTREEMAKFNQELANIAAIFKQVIVIAGNHDRCLWNADEEKREADTAQLLRSCQYLFDQSISICGVKFFGSPWTPLFDDSAFMLTRGKSLDTCWSAIPEDTDVLITHGPPLGILDSPKQGNRAGCLALLNHVITRVSPRYHVFGHIHAAYGVASNGATTFINAAICDAFYRPFNRPVCFDVPIPKKFCKESMIVSEKV